MRIKQRKDKHTAHKKGEKKRETKRVELKKHIGRFGEDI